MTERPTRAEYAPFYHGYIEQVPTGDIVETLESQLSKTIVFLNAIGEARSAHRYAEGKWTIKEVVGHLIDAERIFAYRALRIARGDKTALPGYDENAYAQSARFNDRRFSDLVDELNVVRRANLFLYRSFNEEEWLRTGTADGKPVSARALAYISAGHESHHLDILQSRYLR